MPGSRDSLRPHTFIGVKGGESKDYTFYAKTFEDAVRMALRWGRKRKIRMYHRKNS